MYVHQTGFGRQTLNCELIYPYSLFKVRHLFPPFSLSIWGKCCECLLAVYFFLIFYNDIKILSIIQLNINYFRYGNYSEAIEGIFGLSLEFKNRLLIAEKYKKKQPTVFCSWPLRRRTDEEIIRLCAYRLLQCLCQNQNKG